MLKLQDETIFNSAFIDLVIIKIDNELPHYRNISKIHIAKLQKEATETCKKYLVTVIFYYIFHIKPHFLKTLFQSQFLFDFDDFFTNKGRIKCSFTL